MTKENDEEMETEDFKNILEDIQPDDASIELVAKYLGYKLGTNPIDPENGWKVFLSNRITSKDNVTAGCGKFTAI
jgi:hypothetical protein